MGNCYSSVKSVIDPKGSTPNNSDGATKQKLYNSTGIANATSTVAINNESSDLPNGNDPRAFALERVDTEKILLIEAKEDAEPINYNMVRAKTHTLERMILMIKYNRLRLGLPECTFLEMEKAAYLIFDSMEAPTRIFHNIEHLRDLCVGGDPIQVAAIGYHDIIYYQIDGGLSPGQREYLDDVIVINPADGSVAITEEKLENMVELVMDIFGYVYGQVLNPFKGMNEFLSAIVAVRASMELDRGRCPDKSLSLNAKMAACIEATIPFRPLDEEGRNPAEALFDRLVQVNETYTLNWNEEEMVKAVQRSADLGNKDLDNFSWKDNAKFLSITWKLIPESNVTLRRTSNYIGDITLAMKKMAGFFGNLDPDTLYFSFRDPEKEVEIREKVAQARINIQTAEAYMNCKLLAMSILSAAAELSGGDAPISLFVGDRPAPNRPESRHLHNFLDMSHQPADGLEYHPEVMTLLRDGREMESHFDTRKSPIGAFLYSRMGDIGVKESLKHIVCPMDGEHSRLLLDSLPVQVATELLKACSELAFSRREKIAEIISSLGKVKTMDTSEVV